MKATYHNDGDVSIRFEPHEVIKLQTELFHRASDQAQELHRYLMAYIPTPPPEPEPTPPPADQPTQDDEEALPFTDANKFHWTDSEAIADIPDPPQLTPMEAMKAIDAGYAVGVWDPIDQVLLTTHTDMKYYSPEDFAIMIEDGYILYTITDHEAEQEPENTDDDHDDQIPF